MLDRRGTTAESPAAGLWEEGGACAPHRGLGLVLALAASTALAREGAPAQRHPAPPGAVLLAQASTLDAAIDGALDGVATPIAYATRLELIEARLRAAESLLARNDWPAAAAQVQGAATYAAGITVPQRSQAALAELAAGLAGIPERLDARAEDGAARIGAVRAALDARRTAALRVGGDVALNQLRTTEVLLQVTAGLYGEAVGVDGAVGDPDLLEFARGTLLSADALYRAAQPELEGRLQGATYVLTDTMETIGRLLDPERDGPLAPPSVLVDGVELFLSYSSYL